MSAFIVVDNKNSNKSELWFVINASAVIWWAIQQFHLKVRWKKINQMVEEIEVLEDNKN